MLCSIEEVLSNFFVKKKPLSWRIGYVMDGSVGE